MSSIQLAPAGKRWRKVPHIPYLSFAPSAWTLSLVYAGGGLNSLGGIAIDGEGNLWADDNFLVGSQSTIYSGFGGGLSKLAPNGKPLSPMTTGFRGGGIDGPGFGIAVSADDRPSPSPIGLCGTESIVESLNLVRKSGSWQRVQSTYVFMSTPNQKGRKRMKHRFAFGASAALLALFAVQGAAQDSGMLTKGEAAKLYPDKPLYSRYAGRDFPTRPFFGDTHLHTSFSMDAGAFGARLGPREAYRFARGEQLTSSSGQPVKLSRPLDFLVVADHSDNMGFFPDLLAGKPGVLADPIGKKWYDMVQSGKGADAAIQIIVAFSHNKFPEDLMYYPATPAYKNAWQKTIDAAEEFNESGRFTAFIGYEWTSNTGGNNLHRNVIFRDGGVKASQVVPFTVYPPFGSDRPEDLWKWMKAYEDKTGGSVLAIAHNGNLSNGLMFPVIEAFGGKIDSDYAKTRAKWERLYEVTQTKGTGEAHPYLSPNDEFADFELWDKGNLDGSVAKKKSMLEFEYARSAFKNGLKLAQELGTNPYQFGLVGSSDAHTGLAAMQEDNFFGKTTPQEPNPERVLATFVDNPETGIKIMDWEVGASGYAAVWATENTRASIWDAMQRKETYATTGPRMIVRFFGGWDFEPSDAEDRLPARTGYSKGVSMGGFLGAAPGGKAPTFLVAALKDPIGANLDRYQIVKGWLDADGELHEKIYDVVWSGDRKPGDDGKLPPVGNTVDVANATWTNTIGAPELITVWSDPDFDPSEPAFYYGRVLEIPKPRWTAYDAKFYVTEPLRGTVMTLQDRAYTSPIWYTPES